MEARELRIGNIVLGNYDGKDDIRQIEVVAVYESGCIHADSLTCPGTYDEYNEEFLSGVPLTEEIMLRAGFKKNGDEFTHLETFMIFEYWDSYGYCFTAGEGIGLSSGCLYLHQLQNLYFALTGEELTLNEDEEEKG